MYKIILVDDEAEVRDSIVQQVDWESHGFVVCGTAGNGKEACTLLETEDIDVVMTDIKMPYMDGLELSARIREKFDNMKIIIFSGYDDFSYAKEAIRYKVENYIMKPINQRELEEAVEAVRRTLDNERDSEKNLSLLKERYASSLPRITESLALQLIRGDVNDEVKRELSENCPDLMFANGWIAASVKTEKIEDSCNTFIYKDIEDVLQRKHIIIAVRESDRLDIIFGEKDNEKVINALENLSRDIKNMFDISIFCGVGRPADMLGTISRSFNEASGALDILQKRDMGSVAYYGDIAANRGFDAESPVNRAINYIEKNYSDTGLSVETVADSVGFSHSYFSSIFKKEVGEACSVYITKIRMEKAAKLLEETNAKTYVIALETGYSDVAYFSYAFKHYFGVAPTKYRKSRGES